MDIWSNFWVVLCQVRSWIQWLLDSEGVEDYKQVTQKGCGCFVPGNFQGQLGPGSEQPYVAVDVHVHGKGNWTKWPLKIPSNSKESMVLPLWVPSNSGYSIILYWCAMPKNFRIGWWMWHEWEWWLLQYYFNFTSNI